MNICREVWIEELIMALQSFVDVVGPNSKWLFYCHIVHALAGWNFWYHQLWVWEEREDSRRNLIKNPRKLKKQVMIWIIFLLSVLLLKKTLKIKISMETSFQIKILNKLLIVFEDVFANLKLIVFCVKF